ncbi:APC family permease [Actinoplanes sp. Pm04-4]|uniref:APC family permease n=1 Tax=Paractinoplanes pyxinae TaxID=2997416 RepID=A0ABT4BE06_9ACTN|nr:APC family permease [Actinoplanes pyxinae]MCY1144055.1 APC family permease [Actinoplanes pyxinae]
MRPHPASLRQHATRHRLSTTRLTFHGLGAVTPLTIIIGAVPLGFGQLHQIATPAGYLLAAAILGIFATGLSTVAAHLPHAGALHSYVAAGLGAPAAGAAAIIALIAYSTILVGLFGAFGPAADRALRPAATDHAWWALWAVLAWAMIAVLTQLKARTNMLLLTILVTAEISYVLALNVVLLAHPADGYPLEAINPAPLLSPTGMGSLMGAITGLIGFEVPLAFALIAVHRTTTVRRAIRTILATTGLLYASTGLIMTITAGPGRIIALAQQHPTDLYFVLAAPHVPAWVIQLGVWLFATSLFAAMLAFATTIGRYTLTLARDGKLPPWLAITRHDEVPVTAGITQSALTLLALAVCVTAGADPAKDLFFYGTTAGGLGVLTCMTLAAVAVVAHLHRHPHGEKWRRRRLAPITATFLLIVITALSTLYFGDLVRTTDPVKTWAPALVYLAAGVSGALWIRRQQQQPSVEHLPTLPGAEAVPAPRPAAGITAGSAHPQPGRQGRQQP